MPSRAIFFSPVSFLLTWLAQPAQTYAQPSSVFSHVPETVEEGYLVLYELEAPLNGGFRGGDPVPYTSDNSLTVPDFDRVAYYLELTDSNGTKWVYASMDAFAKDPIKLGLPHNKNNPVVHQRNVQNLNVSSNVVGIESGTFIDTGHIEMWSGNYGTADSYGVLAASNNLYDWGDSGASASAGYGSFQIHNTLARQTLLAYNGWGISGNSADDIGIGSQPTGHPDWTHAGNAGNYTTRKLVVLVRPRSHDLSFTTLPRDRQLYSRNPISNTAIIPIEGTESFGGHDRVILKVYRNGILFLESDQALEYDQGAAEFFFYPEIEAELASYDFELLLDQGGTTKVVERVSDVVAGDAYLVYGQSNAEAMSYGDSRSANEYATRWLRTFGQNGDSSSHARNILHWVEAEGDGPSVSPGSIGQWAMVMGSELVNNQGIPIAILNGARGGYSIDRLQKDRENPDLLSDGGGIRRPYNRLRYRAIEAGISDTARALFYYQGEQDRNNPDVHSAGFATLMEDWKIDYPGLERVYVTQVRPGCGVQDYHTGLRDAQRRFADVYPNISVMATNGISNHDGCHFLFTAGYEDLGIHYFRMVARDFYGAAEEPNIDPINPEFVAFTDATRTELKIVVRDKKATIDFPPGALAHFVLRNTSATITGRSVSGHTIYFQLSGPASPDAVLEYRSHFGEGEWVTNANGVGLLTFIEPVLPFTESFVVIRSPTVSREAEVGERIEIEAVASAGPGESIERMVLYANGVPQFEIEGKSLNTTWQPSAPGTYRLTVRAYVSGGGAPHEDSITVVAGGLLWPGGVNDGLQAWFKTEAGVVLDNHNRVLEWQDQSGQGRHVLQNTAAARPMHLEGLYGLGAGIWFGGGDFLTSASGMPTGDYTKIVRFTITSDDPNYLHNLVSSAEGGTSSVRDHALYLPDLRPTLFHRSNFVGTEEPIEIDQPAVLTGTYHAPTRAGNLYLNGSWMAEGTAGGPNTKTSFQLGAYTSAYFLHGSISEVMIYDRVLNGDERQAVMSYLEEKYLTPYDFWRKGFAFDDEHGAPGADPDGDRLPNAIEYAFGLDPTSPGSGSDRLPYILQDGTHLEVLYLKPDDRPDAYIELERSEDLHQWTPVPSELIENHGNLETWVYTEELPRNGKRIFFRLRVAIPGPDGFGFSGGAKSGGFTEKIASRPVEDELIEPEEPILTVAEFMALAVGTEIMGYQFLSAERFRFEGKEGSWLYEPLTNDTSRLLFFYDDGGEREVSLTFTTPASVMFDGQSIDLLFDFFGLRPSDANQRTSLWLGTFDQRFFNPELNEGWIRHEEHGWLYASGRGYDRGIWFWDHIQQDWLWSRASVYPFFFSDRRMTWIYYRSGGRPESRDFYSYETEAKGWFKVES